MIAASTASSTGISQRRSANRLLTSAPIPVKTRIDASVTVSEYVGYPRNRTSRWIIVIS